MIPVYLQSLLDLPDELLLEVISYFEAPDPLTLGGTLGDYITSFSNVPTPSPCTFERREVLIALSETCRRLRQVFRPFVWERIEVLNGMLVGQPRRKLEHGQARAQQQVFSKELLRQLRVATKVDPSLAQYVRIVNVQVTNAALRSVFLELGRSFSFFLNLHTVRIVQEIKPNTPISISNQKAVRRGFRTAVTYPQIQSASLSAIAYPLLEVCPNIRNVRAATGFNFEYLLKSLTMAPHPHLRSFSAGHRLDINRAKIVAEALPSLEEITIHLINYYITFDEIRMAFMGMLKSFRNIRILTIIKSPIWIPGISIKDSLLSLPRENFKTLTTIRLQSLGSQHPEMIINFPTTR